jgi:hypothetical protein
VATPRKIIHHPETNRVQRAVASLFARHQQNKKLSTAGKALREIFCRNQLHIGPNRISPVGRLYRAKLNLYGFKRITHGRDANSYYHEYFLRYRPVLLSHICRTKRRGNSTYHETDPGPEPDFYSMPALTPVTAPHPISQHDKSTMFTGAPVDRTSSICNRSITSHHAAAEQGGSFMTCECPFQRPSSSCCKIVSFASIGGNDAARSAVQSAFCETGTTNYASNFHDLTERNFNYSTEAFTFNDLFWHFRSGSILEPRPLPPVDDSGIDDSVQVSVANHPCFVKVDERTFEYQQGFSLRTQEFARKHPCS